MGKLEDASLDEIRFHLDLDSKELWKNLELAVGFNFNIGVEIPCIPGKEDEIRAMIDYISDKVSFLNLNELEVADNELSKLGEMGFDVKDNWSYGVKGSVKLGLKLIDYIQGKDYELQAHLCSAKLKDAVQLSNRIKREGKIVKRKFDEIDDEGLLTRGALYLSELAPGVGYRKKLENKNNALKKEVINKLRSLFEQVKEKLRLRDTMIAFEESKPRILLSKSNAKKHKRKIIAMGLLPAVVTEYPTADQLEVEVEFLN